MKVEAYKCDYCKNIYDSEQMTGIKNESDLFDRFMSFPTSKEPSKADCHFCLECYRVNVEISIKNKMNWRDGEKYDAEREALKHSLHKEYFYIFKHEVIRRYLEELGRKKKK
jgi:hypothetical protein